MEQYIMGIDIGTSACKAAVFSPDGRVISAAKSDYPVYYPRSGWAEQDPGDWWKAVCLAVRETLEKGRIDPKAILGIGVDGQSWSAVMVDRDGQVLANTPIWMDTRASDICRETEERIGKERILKLCGNPFQPSYTTPKILWYRKTMPTVYERAYKVLQSNSFIVYRLTGALTQDMSQGYGLHCFNMRTGEWDPDMRGLLGIPEGLLPDIFPCHQIVGHVTRHAAAQCGLLAGTPVAAGGLDAACGALGAGVLHSGETQEQGGQAGGMSICMDTYQSDPRLILSFHVVPGRWLLQGGTTGGGGVMRWLARELGQAQAGAWTQEPVQAQAGMRTQEPGRAQAQAVTGEPGHGGSLADEAAILKEFNRQAADVPPGSDGLIFLPYMAGERSPIWDPAARGVYFGLDYGKTRGHLIRAAMEGVACSLRHNLDVAEAAGAHVTVLRSVGGSANSLLWTQIKSDITGKRIVVPSSDTATTLGAAMLAGVGAGVYRNFEEAAASTVENLRFHEPNPENREVYERSYRTYGKLYEALKELMGETYGIV